MDYFFKVTVATLPGLSDWKKYILKILRNHRIVHKSIAIAEAGIQWEQPDWSQQLLEQEGPDACERPHPLSPAILQRPVAHSVCKQHPELQAPMGCFCHFNTQVANSHFCEPPPPPPQWTWWHTHSIENTHSIQEPGTIHHSTTN